MGDIDKTLQGGPDIGPSTNRMNEDSYESPPTSDANTTVTHRSTLRSQLTRTHHQQPKEGKQMNKTRSN